MKEVQRICIVQLAKDTIPKESPILASLSLQMMGQNILQKNFNYKSQGLQMKFGEFQIKKLSVLLLDYNAIKDAFAPLDIFNKLKQFQEKPT